MRIKWIELINYGGIYNGMGLNEIHIDFTLCKTNKIIIRGLNGSGKTTLMDAISIHPDANEYFIPNIEARKNICVIDNGIEYIIRYIHPVTNSGRGTTKAYISKFINGQMVEMNPNGNISSCRDIIFDEFNLDANFLALSKLSYEDRGLVGLKPAERKKLLSNIINTLEVYNNIHKSLSKKASIFRSTINSLVYKIDMIGDETVVKLNLEASQNRINQLEEEKNHNIEAIAATKVKISEYINILQQNNYDQIVSELSDVSKNKDLVQNQVNRKLNLLGIESIDRLTEFLEYLNKQYIELDTLINTERQRVPIMLAQRESECRELQNKQEKLNALQSEYNYFDMKKALTEARKTVSEYDRIFAEMGLKNIHLITKEEFDLAMESIFYLKASAENLIANYYPEQIQSILENRIQIQEDIKALPINRKNIDQLKYNLSEIEREILIYESKRNIAKELINRPKGCTIDSCPYIKSALDADILFPEIEYNKLIQKKLCLQEQINTLTLQISSTEESAEIFTYISNIERELKSKMRFIQKLPVIPDFEEAFLQRIINHDHFKDIDELYKYVDCGNFIEEYKVAKNNLHNYEVEYKIYESKNEIIESIISDLTQLTEKTSKMAKEIEETNKSIFNKEIELEKLKKCIDDVKLLDQKIKEELNILIERESSLIKTKNVLDSNTIEIQSLQQTLEGLNNSLGSVNNDIKRLSEERDKLNHSLQMLSEYKSELEMYQTKFTKLEKIRYYSSPSTGIQTVFMELYMNRIISTANELLSYLFGGEFVIQPFIIDDKGFRIPCLGNGIIHDDISNMSSAQKNMISMIISFALLHQSSTKYNIIRLDEIDGCLDNMNRSYFTTLLDKLMYMLNCEQCFMVSHNNELDTSMCDLIVLKQDPNENYVGNIIWQYNSVI